MNKVKRHSVEFKLGAIKLYNKGNSANEVAEGLCISPKTLYGWLLKYNKYGAESLENWSRITSKGTRKPEAVVEKVLETKKENPGMGVGKMSAHLGRFALLKIAANTIRRIIQQYENKPVKTLEEVAGSSFVKTRRRRIKPRRISPKKNKPKQVRYFERSSPNTLWQMDIMTFMLKGQYRIYLIGIIDDYSRFIVSHGLFRRQTEGNVMEVVRAGMEKYKSPKEILTDNGRQFYSWRGKSKFTKFCIKTGIQHIRSRPYHPQTLGKIESFWRNLYQEYLGETPLSSFEEAQAGISNWIRNYNYKRVHLGIGGLVPADRFFGVSNQVEKLMKEGAQETEKALAQNPGELKSPMYLVGKIGDREIRVVAKNGELIINEENTPLEAVDLQPKKDVELSDTGNVLHEREVADGGDKNEGHSSGTTTPETNNNEYTIIIEGGSVTPANKRDGEVGSGVISAEQEEESGGCLQGSECEQGRILQVDEACNSRDEGIAKTCWSGQEGERNCTRASSTQGNGETEQTIAEGKSTCGNTLSYSEDISTMAERGKGTER